MKGQSRQPMVNSELTAVPPNMQALKERQQAFAAILNGDVPLDPKAFEEIKIEPPAQQAQEIAPQADTALQQPTQTYQLTQANLKVIADACANKVLSTLQTKYDILEKDKQENTALLNTAILKIDVLSYKFLYSSVYSSAAGALIIFVLGDKDFSLELNEPVKFKLSFTDENGKLQQDTPVTCVGKPFYIPDIDKSLLMFVQ